MRMERPAMSQGTTPSGRPHSTRSSPINPEHCVFVFGLQQKLQVIPDICRPLPQTRSLLHVLQLVELSLQPLQRV